jgi:hypothetical protein
MKISKLINELENRKQNYGDMNIFDITGRPFTHTVMIYEDNKITLQIRS